MKGEIIMLKKYEVAISDNGICSKCKMVSEEEYKRLQTESEKALAKEKADKDLLLLNIQNLFMELEKVKREIRVLKGEE